MRLTIIGCSDAFGSGGRFHSCYLLDTSQGRLMLDCGANSPLALKAGRGRTRLHRRRSSISHCHGDHFGGLPFLFLERMFIERGPKPMEILGPPGIEPGDAAELFEALYPSHWQAPDGISKSIYRELEPGAHEHMARPHDLGS